MKKNTFAVLGVATLGVICGTAIYFYNKSNRDKVKNQFNDIVDKINKKIKDNDNIIDCHETYVWTEKDGGIRKVY
jgi:hypothetical protein